MLRIQGRAVSLIVVFVLVFPVCVPGHGALQLETRQPDNLAGYFDQAHLTRSLKYRMGQTPAEIARAREQLSFLYKTTPLL